MFNRPASVLLSIPKLAGLIRNPCTLRVTGAVSRTDMSMSYLDLIIASLLDQFIMEAV